MPYARQVFKNKDRLNRVVQESMTTTNKMDLFKKISRELMLALGLIMDYSKGNYREVKKEGHSFNCGRVFISFKPC